MLNSAFPFFELFFVAVFVTVTIPVVGRIVQHYLKEISASQVPGKIVMRASLQQKNGKTEMENIATVRIRDQPLGAAADAALSPAAIAHGKLTAPSLAHPISATIHAAP